MLSRTGPPPSMGTFPIGRVLIVGVTEDSVRTVRVGEGNGYFVERR